MSGTATSFGMGGTLPPGGSVAGGTLARARVPGRVRVPLHVNDMKQEG